MPDIITFSMSEAIRNAKNFGTWSIVENEPTSVNVRFLTRTGREDETQFDLYDEKENELCTLWLQMHDEFEADFNSVIAVEALGYIAD